jgi:phage tail sheath gpL-like
MAVLTAAVCVLAAIVLVDLALTFGLIRHLRLALDGETLSLGAPLDIPPFVAVGSEVASFKARALDGGDLTTSDVSSGSVVVAYFSAGCEGCTVEKDKLLGSAAPEPLVAFVTATPDGDASDDLARELATVAHRVAVVDQKSSAVNALDVQVYPTFVRLEDGVVSASGYRLSSVIADVMPVG